MNPLWTAAEAATATGGCATGDWACSGVSIDTRTLQPGDLFVALKAARDGHDFVAQALEAGAAAALVSHVPEGVAEDAPLLIVDEVLPALENLGKAARARTNARVVAVTGSVGKTSTKEMLRTVLSSFGLTHAAEASYNNHWGVPLTLARMPADTEFAVIEIGMNHPGEIAPLSAMARPHVTLITTVAAAHLEAFDNIDGIAREKASILDGLVPGGAAVLNADIDTAAILQAKAKETGAQIFGFGAHPEAICHLIGVELSAEATEAEARLAGTECVFDIAAVGRHFAMNGLAVLGVTQVLKLDRAQAIEALGRWSPVTGRGARQKLLLDPKDETSSFEMIDDSYNANPASMAASLDVLAATQGDDGGPNGAAVRQVAILGDMKELGPTGPALHAGFATSPAMAHIDRVHCVGPLMRHLWEALPEAKRGLCSDSATDMAAEIPGEIAAGDVVLIKGSLSTGLGRVVDVIRKIGHSATQ